MSTLATGIFAPAPSHPDTSTIHTTLYDLIEAISAEVGPQEDHLVTATLVHLINSGRVKFADDARQLQVVSY
jgi:hypothetical protein